MVRTEKQLNITKEKLTDFERQLAELESRKDAMQPIRYKLDKNALTGMIDTLREEIKEYETLSDENCKSFTFENFEVADFADMLIKARLVRKMSQTELAKAIDVDPQQIQRYEANGYEGVSFARLLEIQYALRLKINCSGKVMSNDIFKTGEAHNEEMITKVELQLKTSSIFETNFN